MTDIVYRTGDTISALYDTRASAEAAMGQLRSAGIPDDAIKLRAPNPDSDWGGSSTTGTETAGSTTSASTGMGNSTGMTTPSGSGYGANHDFMGHEEQGSYDEALRRGGCLVVVSGLSRDERERAADILEMTDAVDFDEREESWRSEGWTGGYSGATTGAGGVAATGGAAGFSEDRGSFSGGTEASGEQTIPVVDEELRVGKRDRNSGRVKVRSYVREEPVSENVSLRDEHVNIERRPVDRPVGSGDSAFQDRTIEATEHHEEAVVEKQARVKEEITLNKDVETRTETVEDTVRHTEVEIDRDTDTDRR